MTDHTMNHQVRGRSDSAEVSSVTVLPWLTGTRRPSTGDGGDPRTRALSEPEVAAVLTVGLATLVLGVIGLVNSFRAVAEAAEPSFGGAAWTVPLAVDIGILVFSALDLVLARLDMRVAWLRLLPWSLVAVTIYLNVADEHTWFGRIAHAVLPALWVVAVEVGTHAVRIRAGLGSVRRMDRIRGSRWLLAPLATARLWRRMVLWETRSYPDALARERRRLLALCDLQDAWGRIAWRWKAPRRARALYRLGELAPTGTDPTPDTGTDVPADEAPDTDRAPKRTPSRTPGRTRGRTRGRTSTWTDVADTGAEVARLRTQHPDMSATDIAARLGVTDRTVRRHLAAQTNSTNANGIA